MSDEITDAISSNATGPQKVTGDSGSVEMHPLDKQIEAAKFLQNQDAGSRKKLGLRFRKLVPPGAV